MNGETSKWSLLERNEDYCSASVDHYISLGLHGDQQ